MNGRPRLIPFAALSFTALACAATVALACAPRTRGGAASAVLESVPPAGADLSIGVEWRRITLPGGKTLPIAVARPTATGRHGVLVILHGTHGFAREYADLAREFAREAEAVVVAACWFGGRRGLGTRFVTAIDCPEAPPMPSTGMTREAFAVVDAVVEAARSLPGVQAERVALLGHSRGAVAALNYALERGGASPAAGLRAVVLNSGAYPPELVARVGALGIPTLLLHGNDDNPAGGGSEMTAVGRARLFVGALEAAKKIYEVEYFEGAGHEALFTDSNQRARSVRRVGDFLSRHGFE